MYARVPSSSRASGGRVAVSRDGGRSQRTSARRRRRHVSCRAGRAAQVEAGVVPAHPVEQPGEFGDGARGDEEVGAARRRRGHRAQREPHPLQPHQRPPPRRCRHVEDVEGPPDRQQHRRARDTATTPWSRRPGWRPPGPRARSRADARPASRTAELPQEHSPFSGPGARHATSQPHRPVYSATAVTSLVRVVRAERPRRQEPGRGLLDAPAAADREAHAPSNGSAAPVVTTPVTRS